ncbi:MAG: hypothetical protein R3F41_14510 [Gammaproteobacteria bacterium]|nr:hypothetical protein [Pseudomonadales bacterium]MCP5347190.1 hypothetical protein [Pseudomonadales bacterium]
MRKQEQKAMRSILGLILLTLALPLAAQTDEPDYRFHFIPDGGQLAAAGQPGLLEVSVQPPDLGYRQPDTDSSVPVELSIRAVVYPGRWLDDSLADTDLAEAERFVRAKLRLFQTAVQPQQYRQWLDEETYAVFAGSVASGEIDLAEDRQFYRQYDSLRLLASLRYGVYSLLYVQFHSTAGDELVEAVMPVRRVAGRLITAGSLHAASHELYRMLAFGSLQRQLHRFLELRVNN